MYLCFKMLNEKAQFEPGQSHKYILTNTSNIFLMFTVNPGPKFQ